MDILLNFMKSVINAFVRNNWPVVQSYIEPSYKLFSNFIVLFSPMVKPGPHKKIENECQDQR